MTTAFLGACQSCPVAAKAAEFRRVAGIVLRHKGLGAGRPMAPPPSGSPLSLKNFRLSARVPSLPVPEALDRCH